MLGIAQSLWVLLTNWLALGPADLVHRMVFNYSFQVLQAAMGGIDPETTMQNSPPGG